MAASWAPPWRATVDGLVAQSLVRRPRATGPRFTMLETIRAVGLEQLRASGEEAGAQDAHAAFMIAFANRASEQLEGRDEPIDRVLRRMTVEQANILAALTWLAAVGDADGALRLSSAMAIAGTFR